MKKTLLLLFALSLLASVADAQTYRIAEMSAEQISRLNKEKTVVLIPGGILEEHGPYLPSFTDGFWNQKLTDNLARAIVARPGWSVVIFPTIPLGNSGANDIGGKYHFPGTYAVRFSTLRALFMDLATELGEQQFKWVFIIHGHGAPNHNRALDQTGDYFRDTYGGHMVNLTGLMPVISAWDGKKTKPQRQEDGLVIHSGMDETSMMLALRPDLVRPGYKAAKPLASHKMEELIRIAQAKDWPGYFGSPRLASRKQYERGWKVAAREALTLALKILNGFDERQIVRFADEMQKSAPDVALDEASLKHEEEIRQKQADWLKKKGLP
jgi:creatinine amidohydrolase/Fe(II)-dependent formamide hydrolase-like protein